MDSRDAPDESEAGVGVRVLLPDGGQMEPPEEEGEDQPEGEETDADEEGEDADTEQQGEEGEEAESDETDEEAESDETDEEAESDETDEETAEGEEEAESEREKAVSDEGARILHLNLDGLFLDLLGLEVDLDTVTLDITAVTGESKLLGNLLSAVSGLLGGDPLSDLLPENPLGDVLPDLNPMERARGLAASVADAVEGSVEDAGSSIVSALPLEELLAEFLQAIVDQLLETADADGGGAEGEEAAASA